MDQVLTSKFRAVVATQSFDFLCPSCCCRQAGSDYNNNRAKCPNCEEDYLVPTRASAKRLTRIKEEVTNHVHQEH